MPHGAIAHLAKEVGELAERPFDDMEYADCMLLLLDAASNAGLPADDLLNTCWEKLAINRARTWGEPDENNVIEHVRDDPPQQ